MTIQFKKAVKYEAKGRVALIGPAGSGKSFTMLKLARELAGPEGAIAAIDTEHGSLSKYADLFDFDVMDLDSYSPTNFLEALSVAAQAGYSVFCADSLSHFWMGKDGALEFVDDRSKRSGKGDSFAGWKDFRPHERAMIDGILASPMHVIVTMRTKNDYVEEVNERGKKVRRKIGLAPVQREGMEYEFDLVGLMDEENTLIVDKTRCPAYAQKALTKPGKKEFAPFIEWLAGKPAEAKPFVPPTVDLPEPAGSSEAAQKVADRKIAEMKQTGKPPVGPFDYRTMLGKFESMKKSIGHAEYYAVLSAFNLEHSNQISSREQGLDIYKAMAKAQKDLEAAQQPSPDEPPAAA